MCMCNDLVKFASKEKLLILYKVVANWIGTNRFCKELQLANRLTRDYGIAYL